MSEIDLANKYTLFPIKDHEMYKRFKTQEVVLWTSNELDFSADKADYENLSPELRNIIDRVNAFFSATDGLIIDNLAHRFLLEAKTLEEKMYFITQLYIESVHAETYSLIINTIVTDPAKRTELFEAANNMKCVRNKNLWMHDYMTSSVSKSERLLAFCCGEGIFFISSFVFIFYFRSKGIFPNIIFANEIISRDETIHRDTGVLLYLREGKLSEEVAHAVVRKAVELECNFVKEVLPTSVEDLNQNDIMDYVKFLGDLLLVACGHKKIWGILYERLPTWIRDIQLNQKGNFYEVKIGNYVKSNLNEALDIEARISGKKTELIAKACDDPSSVDF
jgi:ribonucleotide reductase beta subunit family protein with ferritin-like domain